LPVPDAPDVIVRNVALLAAVHAQVDAAVTGIEPLVAPPVTLVGTLPRVTWQDDVEGAESLFEQAAAASATAADAREAMSRRSYLLAAYLNR